MKKLDLAALKTVSGGTNCAPPPPSCPPTPAPPAKCAPTKGSGCS